jgi:hypothetical protein
MDGQITTLLLGSLLSVGSGAIVFWIGHLANQKTVSAQEDKLRSARAYNALSRILEVRAWIMSLVRALDEQFRDSSAVIDKNSEPGLRIPRLITIPKPFERFESEEVGLALETGDFDLVTKLSQFTFNVGMLDTMLLEFNEARSELNAFIDDHSNANSTVSGPVASFEIPTEMKHRFDTRVGILNQLLASLLENSESNLSASTELAYRFRSSVSSLPGVELPKIHLEDDKP